MQEQKVLSITIPEGCFEGNCYGCFYAKKKSIDSEGKIFCKGEPGGHNFPYEKDGCQYYVSRVIQWIKIIGVIWLAGAGLELLVTIFTR